ncbi:hypothetical protein SAMD00023353_8300110 [Rosellinia necatrix]|uniref:Uncharacterized protein n=1 Tax=Rosellinia necatrix TaxID=77044 RepID=A0A1S8AAS5_ROSNE|nr:hypothetical protein SAMD00023353_8300110 [Rosellinia necatrix]
MVPPARHWLVCNIGIKIEIPTIEILTIEILTIEILATDILTTDPRGESKMCRSRAVCFLPW